MSNAPLVQAENKWTTPLGAFFPGERVVFRGQDLHKDYDDSNWFQLLLKGVTGRDFSEKQANFLSRMWLYSTSFPDPRLWNNRIATLAGAARSSSSLGIAAAVAITDAKIYGHNICFESLDFLKRVEISKKSGTSLKEFVLTELKKERYIPGFGRPITSKDERKDPILAYAKKHQLDQGKYLKLSFEIEACLKESRYKMEVNTAGIVAALSADQNLTALEYYHLQNPAFLAGIIPCYIDATEHPENTFFPFRCSSINYNGPNFRRWHKTTSISFRS